MSWALIDSVQHADAHLALFEKAGVYMIRANGLELMNGFQHDSETAFGRIGVDLIEAPAPRVLIGGLGLGYTLAAVVERLSGRGHVTVAEYSPAVIDWFRRHVQASVLPSMPETVRIVAGDVLALLRGAGRFDLILLDVDNGPEPMVREGNAPLYEAEGLDVLRDALSPGGAVLLWSAFESPDFEARARDAGFEAERRVVANGARPELDHHIYVLRRAEGDGA
jgi:spermidine synthase